MSMSSISRPYSSISTMTFASSGISGVSPLRAYTRLFRLTSPFDWGVSIDGVSVVRNGSASVDSPCESTSSTWHSLHVSPPLRGRGETWPFPCATGIAEFLLMLPPCAGLEIPRHLGNQHNFPSNENTVG